MGTYLWERQHCLNRNSPGPGTFPANTEGAEKKRGKGGLFSPAGAVLFRTAQEAVLIVFHYSARLVNSNTPD